MQNDSFIGFNQELEHLELCQPEKLWSIYISAT